jgi:release factor glutamine methyltransferase
LTSLKNLLDSVSQRLRVLEDDPDVNVRTEARLLIQHGLGLDPLTWIRDPDRLLTPHQIQQCENIVLRRLKREPLSRIVGAREFWSLSFLISPETLDPRPDSECLVQSVLEWCDSHPEKRQRAYRILDLGTGSGCLAISLLTELPQATAVGVDIQEKALHTARLNAHRHGVAERFYPVCGTWGMSLKANFDIILTNPPYIETSVLDTLTLEVQRYDPIKALDGGMDGLHAYRQIIPHLPMLLNQQGLVICEIGVSQEQAVEALLRRFSFSEIHFHRDFSDRVRCVSASQIL